MNYRDVYQIKWWWWITYCRDTTYPGIDYVKSPDPRSEIFERVLNGETSGTLCMKDEDGNQVKGQWTYNTTMEDKDL